LFSKLAVLTLVLVGDLLLPKKLGVEALDDISLVLNCVVCLLDDFLDARFLAL
jgi:hypothetical protein